MDYLLRSYLYLWFESLYKCKIAERLKHEEKEDSQDSHSDSYCDGVT